MTEQFRNQIAKTFALTSVVWAVIGACSCKYFSADTIEFRRNLAWLLGLWALCLFDLLALGKTVQALLGFVAADPENRAHSAIQAFSWGVLKLVCLGIFILLMTQGRSIPTAGLLLGMGTLAIVPLVGGLGVFRNA